jgi:TRAP-type C4-dicarboxylate transport system permease small subunit
MRERKTPVSVGSPSAFVTHGVTRLLARYVDCLSSMLRILGFSAEGVAGLGLIVMLLMTVTDVTVRFLWRAIPGGWELISFLGGIVAGLSVPRTSQSNGHPNVDLLTGRMSATGKNIINSATRLLAMVFFILIAWSLFSMGLDYKAGKEVSQTMKVPFYPVIFALAAAFLTQAFQFLLDILKIWRRHE